MNNQKLEQIFKIQLINLINDLLVVFSQDSFILEVKSQFQNKMEQPNFFITLTQYFSKDIEECIINKNDANLFKTNYTFIPTSKEDIVKFKLIKYWNILSIKNKDKVWEYLNILLQIYKNIK